MTTHRMSKTPEHNTWCEIRRRCGDPKRQNFATHGARGIRVCDRWMSFENFYEDMGPRPCDRFSIERIDNDGDYEPGNCRWATASEQSLNTRRNLIVTAFGRTAPLGAFVGSGNGSSTAYKRAWKRITKYGWDAERALEGCI